jgi:acetyl-CoA acetyltransferase
MIGLLAYGAYIPRLRLQRAAVFDANKWFNPGLAALAKGERSMASWDEDCITMAVEAARDCLTSIDRNTVSSVEAGITKPREQLSLMEVHDCFSVTELVTMEDLFVSEVGQGWKDVLDGFFDADGAVPCQIDGGLKCFGHPIGASGLRMIYENYLQLLGRAGERQRKKSPVFGLSHNLGGIPNQNVSAVAIVGLMGA